MKVWLNDLKEGDIFYLPSTVLGEVLKCEHLGDAHNMNYRMSRIKYKVLEGYNDNIKEALGDTSELFVNQYVYTDYDTANEALIEELKKELDICQTSIIEHKKKIINCEANAERIRKILMNR